MLIIIDKKIPEQSKVKLRNFGLLIELETAGITYGAISGHPDIFFTMIGNNLVVAPNLPKSLQKLLLERKIDVVTGIKHVGSKYPENASYNAVVTEDFLVHHQKITDSSILKRCEGRKIVHVNQGYTRCNLIFISPRHVITSDLGISAALTKLGVEILFFNPDGILLPGFRSGFIGGACGLLDKKLFINGSTIFHKDGSKLREFCHHAGVDLVELYPGPLFDGGGIFFC